jgi:hypothetical protein
MGKILCEDIPKDLGPEDAVDTSNKLVESGSKDNEAGEVVLDQSSHYGFGCG